MSEKMYPIPFKSLMNWIVTEYAREGEIFGVHTPYYASGKTLPIFSERIETPFGPAAGPNSQLAQNIIAAYFAGARFFEVKTVQKMDGAELAACVPRPCILAADEGYNQEWSTELEIPQARDEYIKAWCALKILSKVYGLGDPNGFVFNMSVGYDLEGIKGDKVNTYIDNMMDASETKQFKECLAVLAELFPAEKDFIASISPRVSSCSTSRERASTGFPRSTRMGRAPRAASANAQNSPAGPAPTTSGRPLSAGQGGSFRPNTSGVSPAADPLITVTWLGLKREASRFSSASPPWASVISAVREKCTPPRLRASTLRLTRRASATAFSLRCRRCAHRRRRHEGSKVAASSSDSSN